MPSENDVTKNEPFEPTPTTQETPTEQEAVPVSEPAQEEGKPVGEATIVEMESPADIFPPAEENA